MDGLLSQAPNFFLVLIRTGCLLCFWPLWDSRVIPMQVRVYSVLVVALVLTPVVAPALPALPSSLMGLLAMVLRELLLGLSLGLVLRFLWAGVQLAGNLAAIQMGFGMVTLIDPQSQSQNAVVGDLFFLLAILIFLAIDGHHLLLRLLAQSFAEVPMGQTLALPDRLAHFLPALGALIFQLGIKLGAPILAALFLTQLALGIVARSVPQIQVMLLSFPLTITLGLLVLSLTLTVAGPYLAEQFREVQAPLRNVLRAWQG